MTVIHVVEAYEGGVIEFINSLTKQLIQHDHIIIHSERAGDIKVSYEDNVSFIKWPYAQREISVINDLKSALSLLKILRKIEYDAIHLHSSKAGFIGRAITPFLKNRSVIYSPNGAAFNRLDVSKRKRTMYKLIEKIASRLGGSVVSVSHSEATDFLKAGVSGYYINNGIAIEERLQSKLLNEKIIVGTVGRITPQKNPGLFNQIANYFVDNKNVEFIWIGGGELNSALDSPNISITGWLPKSEAVTYLDGIDIYLSTALWEGLPFAVLDAMNHKKALVLNRCTGNIDLIRDNGYLFENLDGATNAINKLLTDPERIVSLGINSFSLLKSNFSVEQMARQYEYAYLGDFEKLNTPKS